MNPDEQTNEPASEPSEPKKSKRGFACMNRERVAEIARQGGKSAHEAGTAHQFTVEEARAAGRKGGLASAAAAKIRRAATRASAA